MEQYTTLKNQIFFAETVIEKSRFLAYAKGVADTDEAIKFVDGIRKKHYDAAHNCFAYIVDGKVKYSDDGEPQGTAGMPIYECIKQNKLNRVCVVVTRYFGGVKLGAGGLVRAYSGSCANILAAAERQSFFPCTTFEVTVDYSLLKAVQKALVGNAVIKNTVFATNVTLLCLTLTDNLNTITEIVVETTNGKVKIDVKEEVVCPWETV